MNRCHWRLALLLQVKDFQNVSWDLQVPGEVASTASGGTSQLGQSCSGLQWTSQVPCLHHQDSLGHKLPPEDFKVTVYGVQAENKPNVHLRTGTVDSSSVFFCLISVHLLFSFLYFWFLPFLSPPLFLILSSLPSSLISSLLLVPPYVLPAVNSSPHVSAPPSPACISFSLI